MSLGSGDHVAWMVSFLREQSKKHVEERELLLTILQDPGLEELVEVARTMPTDERILRLSELRTKRNTMDMHDPCKATNKTGGSAVTLFVTPF